MSIPGWQYAGDESVLGARLGAAESAIEALTNRPRRPGVGYWVLDQDSAGNLVAINLKTNMQYPVTLGAGTAIPG
jgi:hypothetical protein